MDWFSFIELSKLYKNSKVYSREDFFEICSIVFKIEFKTSLKFYFISYNAKNNMCCTDLSKIDRYGESFGGFWLTNKENAYELSQQDNFQGLYELPFPHDLIFKTIDIGCGNRKESVKYSNFLCYWIETKMKQIGMM